MYVGFVVEGLGSKIKVQGVKLRVEGLGHRARVLGLGFRAQYNPGSRNVPLVWNTPQKTSIDFLGISCENKNPGTKKQSQSVVLQYWGTGAEGFRVYELGFLHP